MAFDSTSTPFLMPVNYTNPTFGCQASVQLLTAGGLFPQYTGTGGTFTITTTGNLAALNSLAANGFYVVNAFGFTSVARTLTSGDGSITITNGTGVSGNPIFDVTPNTTVQQINHVYNSGGSPTSTTPTINWIPGGGIGITIADVGGTSTNVTLTSNGLDNDASVLLLAAATGHSANLGVLGTGLVKSTVSGAVSTPSIAVAGTDYLVPTTTLNQIGALSEVDGALITGAGGVWSILNPGTTGQVLRSTGSGIGWTSVGAGTVTSVAVSSTGSTLTISGSPITTTGTINADISGTYPGQTSIITLGTIATGVWNATNIALNKGGTNASLTASNGGIFYSTASAGAILSGTATASQILMSGASGAPSWSVATYPITVATGAVLYGSATNIISSLPAGSAGQILTMSGGEPAWVTDTGTGSVTSVAATSSDLTIGGSPITTTGTLTFALNTVAINKGGTGQTSASAGFNALSPLTTTGDIIYASGANTAARLAIGSSNQVLTVVGGVPAWTSGGEVDVNSIIGTANQIAASSPTGDVTLSLVGPYTPATYTAHGVLLGEGTSSIVAVSPSSTVGLALVSAGASADPAYGTVVVAGGGTGVTSVTTAPTASAFAGWDANANLSADSFIAGYATTATAAGTTTLTVNSVQQQFFTGSTTQTVVLPVTSTMVLGQSFTLVNNSSGAVTVNSSGGNLVQAMSANSSAIVTVILTSGTSAASWSVNYSSNVDGGGTVTSVAATVPSFLSIAGSPITSAGTLALSYSGTALPILNGGTGQTSATAAFNALSPITTTGDIIYASGASTAARLGIGSSGQVLTVSGGVPAWADDLSGVSSITGTADQIAASAATGAVTLSLVGPYTPVTYSTHGVLLGEGSSSIVAVSPSSTVGVALISQGASADPIFGTVAVAGGGTGVTSVTTSPTASAFAGWDSNANLSADSFIAGYATTATAGATTTLTVNSVQQQYFTGSTTQTVVLPVTSTMVVGQSFTIVNNSSGAVTVNASDASLVQTMSASSSLVVTVISTAGTTNAAWSTNYSSSVDAGGTVTSVALSSTSTTLTIGGSPITSAGTLTADLTGGYYNATDKNMGWAIGGFVFAGGTFNTAFGNVALGLNTIGAGNTAFGSAALASCVSGASNTAVGVQALISVTGDSNTAVGAMAGSLLETGQQNTLVGTGAGSSLVSTDDICAFGYGAMQNTTGVQNSAFGYLALQGNATPATGYDNNAFGYQALTSITTGFGNTAVGVLALTGNATGYQNVAIGNFALQNASAPLNNTIVGCNSGIAYTTNESGNIILGANNTGVMGESYITRIGFGTASGGPNQSACFIDGIAGVTTTVADAVPVLISATTGQLGVTSSSRRYKENIEDIANQSDALMNLRPVSFTYIEHAGDARKNYGLIAEEVLEILPDLVVHKDGLPETIRYQELPALLLNEVQKQKKTIDMLMARLEALEAKAA